MWGKGGSGEKLSLKTFSVCYDDEVNALAPREAMGTPYMHV